MTDLLDAYGEVTKAEMKTDEGRRYPAAAYAYVPDPDKSSTWKLRLWSPEPGEKETVAQIGAAVAALGPGGFRGNRVKIPADDLPHVFERLYASKRRPDVRESGSGLGLAIVRELVQAMGGSVWAESEPGGGASLVVIQTLYHAFIGAVVSSKDIGTNN